MDRENLGTENTAAPPPEAEPLDAAALLGEETAAPAAAGRRPPAAAESQRSDLYYWLQALVFALVAIITTFTFFVRIINVVGSSMVPTLHNGDMVLVQVIGYTPKQGDVVVLTKTSFMSDPIVKRIIALGGQRVQIDYDAGTVSVDGQVLSEPYIKEAMRNPVYEGISDLVVPENSIFVMGDNRNGSTDSRSFALGPADQRHIIGKVLCIAFPLSDFGAVH